MIPRFLYRVEFKSGPNTNLRYAERTGGTFASLKTAEDRKRSLTRKYPDADVKVWVTKCDWTLV